jgi:hypothetical protein
MQQNNILSIAFQVHTKEILKEVCCSNSLQWILHTQTFTSLEYISIMFNYNLFNHQGITYHSIMISTALTPTQSIWNSLIPF